MYIIQSLINYMFYSKLLLTKTLLKMSLKVGRNRSLRSHNKKHIPIPTGPLKTIGCRDILNGFSRNNSVLVRLYYPADNQSHDMEKDDKLWTKWLPHPNYIQGWADMMQINWKPFIRVLNIIPGKTYIPVIPNAKPLTSGSLPVIVFSHGLAANRTAYSAICLEMASNGFIVAGIQSILLI